MRKTLHSKFYIQNSTEGFTLIEALVYSALLAIFLGSSILFTSNILSASGRVTERNEILVNQEFVEKKLNWIIGQSVGISSPTAGVADATLTLIGEDSNLYPATVSLINEALVLSMNGGDSIPITNNRVRVTEFSALHVANQNELPALRISLTLVSITSDTISSTINFSYAVSQ